MADVFVSYASEDRDRIRPLVERLEQQGLSVWWDRNLRVGSFFERAIDNEIRHARAVVVVWTRSSTQSHWVIGEAMAGLSRDILVPVLLDEVDVPLPFNARHTAQLIGWPAVASADADRFWAAVADVVASHPDAGSAAPAESRRDLPVANTRPTVAVLPFDGADPDSVKVGEAISAEVIAALACFSTLEVVPRRTAFTARLRQLDVQEIARLLEAQYVVTGHVRGGSDRIRILADLSDGVTHRILWSRSFEVSMNNVAGLELAIAEGLVREIGGEFLRSEIRASASPLGRGMDLWTLLHQARRHFITFNAESLAQSRNYAEKALALVPDEPNALALRASICGEICINGYDHFDEARTATLESLRQAIEIAPRDPVVLKYCGNAASSVGDQQLAVQLLRRSIEINPYDAGAWGYLGGALAPHVEAEKTGEALDILARTITEGARHPGLPFWYHHVGVAHTCAATFDEAARAVSTAVDLQPGLALSWWHLANARGALDEKRAAAEAAERAIHFNPTLTGEMFVSIMRRTATSESAYQRRVQGLQRAQIVREMPS